MDHLEWLSDWVDEAASRRPSIEAIALFGSRLRGTARENSDVDLMIADAQPRRTYWDPTLFAPAALSGDAVETDLNSENFRRLRGLDPYFVRADGSVARYVWIPSIAPGTQLSDDAQRSFERGKGYDMRYNLDLQRFRVLFERTPGAWAATAFRVQRYQRRRWQIKDGVIVSVIPTEPRSRAPCAQS